MPFAFCGAAHFGSLCKHNIIKQQSEMQPIQQNFKQSPTIYIYADDNAPMLFSLFDRVPQWEFW